MNREQTLIELLAGTIPDDPSNFNSETGYGEPQHWMTLPYDRSLEIVYEETGDDKRYYSWRVHCNDREFDDDDFHSTMGVMGVDTSDDLSFDVRMSRLSWAIKVAEEKPRGTANTTDNELSSIPAEVLADELLRREGGPQMAASTLLQFLEGRERNKDLISSRPWFDQISKLVAEYWSLDDSLATAMRMSQIPDELLDICEKKL